MEMMKRKPRKMMKMRGEPMEAPMPLKKPQGRRPFRAVRNKE